MKIDTLYNLKTKLPEKTCGYDFQFLLPLRFANILTTLLRNLKIYSYIICTGKLFRSSDLPTIVEFFLMFHKDKPVDWLLDHILWVKVCNPDKDQVLYIIYTLYRMSKACELEEGTQGGPIHQKKTK